eukprot:GEMP01010817.1.p1 GENE.GEMP01010817.1~~GEMP01010817.1.p1  ORF type:complete len:778 (+),score=212.19 GEMP01010817.1:95-2428(+)
MFYHATPRCGHLSRGLRRRCLFPTSSICSHFVTFSTLADKRAARASHLKTIVEVQKRQQLFDALRRRAAQPLAVPSQKTATSLLDEAHLSPAQVRKGLTISMATFLFHCESRVAYDVGEGYYTIGPCGEELLSAVALALEDTDVVALHYRHLSTSLLRLYVAAHKSLPDIFLDRARGYTVSALDPVSGGHHCCLGGGLYDIVVTSTLASQSPSAVGRAIGIQLSHHLGIGGAATKKFPRNAVSYVSVGDGSVNNAHFLASVNVAQYFRHRGFKCPVVFAISDNQWCISLKGHDWLDQFLIQRCHGMPVFTCDGRDFGDVYRASRAAATEARQKMRPVILVFRNLPRRFGHAATDRQTAYLTQEEVDQVADADVVLPFIDQAVREGVCTYEEIANEYTSLWKQIEVAFDTAAAEPKVTSRAALIAANCQPLAPKPVVPAASSSDGNEKPQVMRKQMTRALEEVLNAYPNAVYMGEDVQHGGYYMVTEGLRAKFGVRVADFPPDETTLLGCAAGYSQVGLLPICELPYAKYLDCGADSFFENVLMNWLTKGTAPQGMVVRLQGFDKGVFGGNFHTHNMLHACVPGLDVVCFSNGRDYVRGLRYAMLQAKQGRVVMLVDSTALLMQRHLMTDGDNRWMTTYPVEPLDMRDFDEATAYRGEGTGTEVLVVTYGNGVPTALRAQKTLVTRGVCATVLDVPYVSGVAAGLRERVRNFDRVVFADVCKFGQHPQASMVAALQAEGVLPVKWRSIGACPTYNPLGQMVTFLSEDDIIQAVSDVTK